MSGRSGCWREKTRARRFLLWPAGLTKYSKARSRGLYAICENEYRLYLWVFSNSLNLFHVRCRFLSFKRAYLFLLCISVENEMG